MLEHEGGVIESIIHMDVLLPLWVVHLVQLLKFFFLVCSSSIRVLFMSKQSCKKTVLLFTDKTFVFYCIVLYSLKAVNKNG